MESKKRTLVIVSHKLHVKNPNNRYLFVKGGFPVITNELAKYFDSVILCVPVAEDSTIDAPNPYQSNIEIKSLPLGNTIYEKILKINAIGKIIKSSEGIIYAMGPNMTGIIGMIWSYLLNKKYFVSIDTDKAEVSKLTSSNKFIGTIKSKSIETFHYQLIKRLAKNRPLFITGNMFLGQNENWHQWVKSTHKSYEIPEIKVPKLTQEQDQHQFKIIFVGRLSAEKNIEVLLHALNELPQEKFKLNIVGEGEDYEKLKSEVKALKLTNVIFKGYLENEHLKESRFLNSDLLVLPSKSERQGKVLLEAMACSVPVIASNTPGIASIISNKENGILFDPQNSAELKNQIEEISNNYDLRKHITKNGYEFSKRHSLDREIKKIINIVSDKYYEE